MATVIVYHQVDDVEHWLASTNRDSVFGALGITVRPFVERVPNHRVGLLVDTPDLDTFERAMGSLAAADAMAADGVRPDTLVILVEP
jgi:hypothetical protein